MRFLIISHVLHKSNGQQWHAYAPYVREMNLWLKHVDEVEVVAPIIHDSVSEIDIAYSHDHMTVTQIPAIAFINISRGMKSLLVLPFIFFKLWAACKRADHIHLRCPGNIGLLGCLVQVFFPSKIKTAKYAGNWDPKAKQPFSYKLQKWILSNTFLTKNMTVLVYGAWQKQSKNIKPFFTASFKNSDKQTPKIKDYKQPLQMVFVGSLVEGKRPKLAIEIVQALNKNGVLANLTIYGDGVLKDRLERYVVNNNLESIVSFEGNNPIHIIKAALKKAHFLLLPSKSEGWPKAVAEAMFFGVIPISTAVSCVPNMLNYGKRGVLIAPNKNKACQKILDVLHSEDLNKMSNLASIWSQQYTLEYFGAEIEKLLVN